MENNSKDTFSYTYSAKEKEEINRIRKKYASDSEFSPEDKMERLRRLDAEVTKKGSLAGLVAGVLGTLVMGTGMSLCMVWKDSLFVPGIIIGVVGMVGVLAAYPLYVRITEKQREKAAPEIIRLTDELLK